MNRIKKPECQRIDAFELWCWRRLLRVPWTARRSNLSILKDINPEYSLEGQMLKLRLQNCGHLMRRADSLLKDPDAGKDWGQEEKWVAEDEMVRWHHWLNGHELEQTLEDSERQGSPESTIHGVTTSGTRLSKWTQNRMGKPLRFFFLHLDMTVIMNQRWLTTRGRDPCIHCALGPVWKTSLRAEKRKNAWVGSSDWTSLPKTLPLIITPPPQRLLTNFCGQVYIGLRRCCLSCKCHPNYGYRKGKKVKSLSRTLCDPMACSLSGSSVHGIFQARILEWVASSSSKVKWSHSVVSNSLRPHEL